MSAVPSDVAGVDPAHRGCVARSPATVAITAKTAAARAAHMRSRIAADSGRQQPEPESRAIRASRNHLCRAGGSAILIAGPEAGADGGRQASRAEALCVAGPIEQHIKQQAQRHGQAVSWQESMTTCVRP